MLWAQMKPLVCKALRPPRDPNPTDAPTLAVDSILLVFSTLFVVRHLKWGAQTPRRCETAALMSWLYYYFIQLPGAIRAVSCSNDFCEEKKLNWHWHICPFFFSFFLFFFLFPLQENGFLSLQFIQLQIYSSAKSTIWYSLSLFFSLWSKSNHSKWLLMVIIATASYWSSGSVEWKQTKHGEKWRGCSLCAVIFGLFIWPLWRSNSEVLR